MSEWAQQPTELHVRQREADPSRDLNYPPLPEALTKAMRTAGVQMSV